MWPILYICAKIILSTIQPDHNNTRSDNMINSIDDINSYTGGMGIIDHL